MDEWQALPRYGTILTTNDKVSARGLGGDGESETMKGHLCMETRERPVDRQTEQGSKDTEERWGVSETQAA